MASALLLIPLLAVAGVLLIRPAAAEIKQQSFKDDPRRSILIDRFSYGRDGMVSISVAGAKVSSTLGAEPDASSSQLVGFFLLSDEALFEAISPEPPLPMDLYPNPDLNNCVLQSLYIIPLFTLADVDGAGHYNKTFPITHADEYSLFFASCVPEAKVTMEVQTHMYNTNPAGALPSRRHGLRPHELL